jgi:hypothetical protein
MYKIFIASSERYADIGHKIKNSLIAEKENLFEVIHWNDPVFLIHTASLHMKFLLIKLKVLT